MHSHGREDAAKSNNREWCGGTSGCVSGSFGELAGAPLAFGLWMLRLCSRILVLLDGRICIIEPQPAAIR